MIKETPKIDTFHGINNALNPCSPEYRQGMAWDAQNSRINASGLWDKASQLDAATLGSVVVRGVPVSSFTSHPHFVDCNVLTSHIIAKYLKDDSHLVVGPNKYAYCVDDNLGSSRAAYWWDGKDAADSATINLIGVEDNIVTVQTTAAHGFHVSQVIDTTGTTNFNTTDKTILTIASTTVFTYAQTLDVANEAAGTVAVAASAQAAGFVNNATACNYAVAGLGRPTAAIAVADNASANRGGRMEVGTYYYMYTYYDTVRDVESLPSDVTSWDALYWSGTPKSAIYPTITISRDAAHGTRYDTNTKVRVYRSFRWHDADSVYNPPNQFYFVGDANYNASADMTLDDYAADTEIEQDPYEGRGSIPPTAVDCLAPFSNRMYYFVGNIAYWSSAGRPEEVAQEYTLTYKLANPNGGGTQTTTVPMQPLLYSGIAGEAKYEISELAGKTIIGAFPLGERLYLWTEDTTGYLKTTTSSEGVKYYHVRKGLGLVSSKTLAHTPYGLFGADREGVWQLDNNRVLKRLSEDVIDINTSTKSTYALQSTLNESFGMWVPRLKEYLWCVVNTGESTVHRQIAYNPRRRIFNGIYAHADFTGGCSFLSTGGAQNFVTIGQTFTGATAGKLAQTLQFWMGQHSLGTVKDHLKVEVIYESITASATVSMTVYQNNIASTTGATTSPTFSHTDSNLVGTNDIHGSGRMFLVELSIPAYCGAPIISIGYSANEILWSEKARR
jgi:hypothetical protein